MKHLVCADGHRVMHVVANGSQRRVTRLLQLLRILLRGADSLLQRLAALLQLCCVFLGLRNLTCSTDAAEQGWVFSFDSTM